MAVELSDLIQQLQELVEANCKLREENRSRAAPQQQLLAELQMRLAKIKEIT